MRIYFKKNSNGFVLYKESLSQSIISDVFTSLVVIITIGMDILFSIYVTHSFVIDILAVLFIFFYMFTLGVKKQEVVSFEQLKEELKNTFKD